MRRMTPWGPVLVLVLAFLGCRDDEDGGSDDTPEATEAAVEDGTTTEPPPGSCPLVTAEAVTEALSQPVKLDAGSSWACDFVGEGIVSVQLSRLDGDGLLDPVAFYDDARRRCADGSAVEVEAGDRAFACVTEGPSAALVQDGVVISILTTGSQDDIAFRDALAGLLPQVTVAE